MEEESIEILAEDIQKKTFIRKITSQTEKHKQNYGTRVELSIWSGLIWFRIFVSEGVFSIQFAEDIVNLFLCEFLTTLFH